MAVVATGELRVVNPATLELVGTVRTTDASAVREIVTEAKLAHEAPLRARAVLLLRVAASVSGTMPQLATRHRR